MEWGQNASGPVAEARPRLHVAFIGTRGVPAHYGGFETAVEEIGARLVERGHRATVYCRRAETKRSIHRGMELVHLPAPASRTAETFVHTALSMIHAQRHRPDVAFVFNAANAPLLPLLKLARVPFATHVDGLEWKRQKWGPIGSRYYRAAEAIAFRWSPAIIADAVGIQDYYRERFDAETDFIAYGAPILAESNPDSIRHLGLQAQGYHLVVARFEPENNVALIIKGYLRSTTNRPLVIVGSSPYAKEFTSHLHDLANGDERIRFLGGVWDQDLLDQLYGNALTYLHGHSVGGTNPSLLRAMGAAAPVLALDVNFNREVAADTARYFTSEADVTARIDESESALHSSRQRGIEGQQRAFVHYDWDAVTAEYERLAERLASRVRR